jgi:hypothetical protein
MTTTVLGFTYNYSILYIRKVVPILSTLSCSDGSLMISEASTDDVGVYECIATSDGQEIRLRKKISSTDSRQFCT